MIECIEKVNNIKHLIEFVDENKCYYKFYHNEDNWIKSDNLRSDFFDRLFELINEGKNYILVVDIDDFDTADHQEETFIGTKEEVLRRLKEEQNDWKNDDREFSDENFVVYNATKNKYVSVKAKKIWKWEE